MDDFIALVKEGFRLAWNLGQLALTSVKAAVLAYFRGVKKWTIYLFAAALAPLLFIVPCLVLHAPLGWLYGVYVVWLVLLFVAELILITPMFLIWRRLKSLFPTVANDLEDWVDFIKSVLFNGLSLGIFVTLFPVWRAPGAFPLLLLVLACWLTLPACPFSTFCRHIYPTVRGVQLLLLFGLLAFEMAFPRQMEQRGWAVGRVIGSALAVDQKEIPTSELPTLKWFNNAGESLVWYSGSSESGFRLWAAPGFDPVSGQELQPVRDTATQVRILKYSLDETTRQVEKGRKDAEQRKLDQERIAKENAAAAERFAREDAAAEKLTEGWPQTGRVDEEVNILEKYIAEGKSVTSTEVTKIVPPGKDVLFNCAVGWSYNYYYEYPKGTKVKIAINLADAGEPPKWVIRHEDQPLGDINHNHNAPFGTPTPGYRIKVFVGEPVKIAFRCKRL